MDEESPGYSHDSSPSVEVEQMSNGAVAHNVDQPEAHCAICHRVFLPDNEGNNLETIHVCGDCKYMFLEGLETTIRDSRRRSPFRGRRGRSRSSDSGEDLFSQQFSNLINLVRKNQNSIPVSSTEHETEVVDGDTAARVLQRTSSRTTPNVPRRWWRSLSDNESEGFDNLDSVFGESDMELSMQRVMLFPLVLMVGIQMFLLMVIIISWTEIYTSNKKVKVILTVIPTSTQCMQVIANGTQTT